MNRTDSRGEAGKAVSGALAIGIGQAGALLIGAAMAVVMPRTLGRVDYGWWILFRSLVQLMASASSIGMADTMVCRYVPRLAAGDPEGAGLVFKTLASARTLAAGAAAGIGAIMLSRTQFPGSGTAAGWLALSVVFQSIGFSGTHLLYGHRRLRFVACVYALQALVSPLAVTVAYGLGGLAYAPPAAAACDAAVTGATLLYARKLVRWPRGWLGWAASSELLRFGAVVGVSSFLIGAAGNVVPYVMARTGYAAMALGFAGLGLRLALLLKGALMSVSGAVFPTLAVVSVTDGMERAERWLSLSTRVGALGVLGALGMFLIAGPCWTGPVFGREFSAAFPVIAGALAALVPLWLGLQGTRVLLLTGRARAMLGCVLVLTLASVMPLWVLPADSLGMMAIVASFGGCAAFAVAVAIAVWPRRILLRAWGLLIPSIVWTLLALGVGRLVVHPVSALVCAVGWGLGFVAIMFASHALTSVEVRAFWGAWRRRKGASPPADGQS